MIISHKYKFIFIKTYKTAGTSIEIFLSKHCGPLDVVTPIFPHVEPHIPRNYQGFYNHIPAHAIRDQIKRNLWSSYFKFCIERNPWDKTLSHFHMKRSWKDGNLTFERYLSERRFPLGFPKYTEPNDPQKIIVDEVLKYERLDDDLHGVFKRLGIPYFGSLGAYAKSEYRTDRRHYHDVYTAEQASLIGDAFSHELLLHGYKF
jgi:hypothetical protein